MTVKDITTANLCGGMAPLRKESHRQCSKQNWSLSEHEPIFSGCFVVHVLKSYFPFACIKVTLLFFFTYADLSRETFRQRDREGGRQRKRENCRPQHKHSERILHIHGFIVSSNLSQQELK